MNEFQFGPGPNLESAFKVSAEIKTRLPEIFFIRRNQSFGFLMMIQYSQKNINLTHCLPYNLRH